MVSSFYLLSPLKVVLWLRETGALDYSLLTSRHPRMHSSTTPYSPVLTLTAAAIIIMCLLMGSPPGDTLITAVRFTKRKDVTTEMQKYDGEG